MKFDFYVDRKSGCYSVQNVLMFVVVFDYISLANIWNPLENVVSLSLNLLRMMSVVPFFENISNKRHFFSKATFLHFHMTSTIFLNSSYILICFWKPSQNNAIELHI